MSSVRREITGTIVANEVRLERSVHRGSFLLIEGDDDYRLFSRFIDDKQCKITICNGRQNLIDAITILHERGFAGAIGFADKDFSDFLGFPPHKGTIVTTDKNDVEIMILCSPALDKIIAEFGDEDRIKATTGKGTPEGVVFNAAASIGAFRLLSHKNQWNFLFEGMSYKFEDKNTEKIHQAKMIDHVFGRTKTKPPVSKPEILAEIAKTLKETDTYEGICSGHDCVRILGRILRKRFGRTDQFNNPDGAKTLGGILRVSYEFGFFTKTHAYSEIRNWEDQSGYRVLA